MRHSVAAAAAANERVKIRGVSSVHLADERMSVGAGGVMPAISGILVQQHAMHRRACVRLTLSPA